MYAKKLKMTAQINIQMNGHITTVNSTKIQKYPKSSKTGKWIKIVLHV